MLRRISDYAVKVRLHCQHRATNSLIVGLGDSSRCEFSYSTECQVDDNRGVEYDSLAAEKKQQEL